MIDIALFHTTLPEPDRKPGGVEIAVHRLANALAAAGDDVVTVYSLGPAPDDARYHHRRLFEGAPWLVTSKIGRWGVLPAALNGVRFGHHDVLHVHGDDWFFLRHPGARVRTFHGTAIGEARSATNGRRRLAYRILDPLERLARRHSDVVLAIGEDARIRYRADEQVVNGVDLARFHPGAKADAPTVLFVGTWEGRKRGAFAHHTFVHDVLPAVPDARLVMVSDSAGPDPHPAVELVLTPDDDTLADLYRQAWVLAYPSTYEGFGIPCLEALASGTAVVATPNDGVAAVVGDDGTLVDDDGFAAAVVDVLTSEEERSRVAVRGPARAAPYDWSQVAARHRQLYELAINRSGRSRRS